MCDERLEWRLPNCWTVSGAEGREVRIDVVQDGNSFVGTAHAGADGSSAAPVGTVDGSVDGDLITMTIYWPGGRIAEYQATVADDDSVSGTSIAADGAATGDWSARPALTPWQ